MKKLLLAAVLSAPFMAANAGLFEPDRPRVTAFNWQGLDGHWFYRTMGNPVCMRGPLGTTTKCYDRVGTGSGTLSGQWGRFQLLGEALLTTTNRTDMGDAASDSNFRTNGNHFGVAYITSFDKADLRIELRTDYRQNEYCLPANFGVRNEEVCETKSDRTYGITLQYKAFMSDSRNWFYDVAGTASTKGDVPEVDMPIGNVNLAVGYISYNKFLGHIELYANVGQDFDNQDQHYGMGFKLPF